MKKIMEFCNIEQFSADSFERVHLEAEIAKTAYSARNNFIGDPNFSKINFFTKIRAIYYSACGECFAPIHAQMNHRSGHGVLNFGKNSFVFCQTFATRHLENNFNFLRKIFFLIFRCACKANFRFPL